MSSLFLHLSLILFTLGGSQAQVNFTTIPELNPGEDKIYVEANIGDVGVSIYCLLPGNVATNWKADGSHDLGFDVFDGTTDTMGYEYFNVANSLPLMANLTYSTPFMKEYDRTEIECSGSGNGSRIFLIGIPAPPKLDNASTTYNVVEGKLFTLDLSSSSDPFPPVNISSTWTINGMIVTPEIGQEINVTLDTYSIDIGSVDRSLTGVLVQLNVSNKHGYDVELFTFNVQYPPEGIVMTNNSVVLGALNGSASLDANVQSLSGNPAPNITWVHPDGSGINFTANDRFSTNGDNNRVLIVDSIKADDYGSYLYTADNGIGEKWIIEIILEQAFPPGAPSTLQVNTIGSQFTASVIWTAPAYLGLPPLSEYEIEVTSEYGTQTLVTNDTVLALTGLYPGTVYMVSVKAVSEIFPEGGDEIMETFETDLSRAELKSIYAENERGNIIMNYELRHIGGYDNENISIDATCNIVDTDTQLSSGSGNSDSSADLTSSCSSDCFDEGDSLQGSLTMSDTPLNAGDVYDCSIHVRNPMGSETFQSNTISLITGKPSIPILTIENMVVLDMRSLYSGIENVTDDRSYFAFNVLVESSSGRVVYNKTFPITKYKSNSTETRTLEGITRSGDYVVLVSASNIYGVSDTATINTTVIVSTTVSPTPTRTTTTSSPSSRPPGRDATPVIAAAVAVPLLIIIIVAIVIAIAIVMLTKKKRGKFVVAPAGGVQPATNTIKETSGHVESAT